MKSGPTEKPKEKKTVVSETVNRKNGRNPKLDHNEWWEKLMMELGSGESAGTDTSAMEEPIFLPQFPIFYRLFTDEVPEAQALTIGT